MRRYSIYYFYLLLLFLCGKGKIIAQELLIPFETKITYDLQNYVEQIDLSSTSHDNGYLVESKLTVASIWNNKNKSQLLHFELNPLKLSVKSTNRKIENTYNEKLSPVLSKMQQQKFYLLLENGMAKEFLTDDKAKNVYFLNLKRGLASLFQFQRTAKSEIDILGECKTFYYSKTTTKVEKFKNNCRNWNLKVSRRIENPLGVDLKSSQLIEYEINDYLTHLFATEKHEIRVNSKNDLGGKIVSTLSLDFKSMDKIDRMEEKNFPKVLSALKEVEVFNLEADLDGRVSRIDSTLKALIKFYKDDLKNYKIGNLRSAVVFANILPTARIAKSDEISQVLKSPSMEDCRHQLLDLFGASQTFDAHQAVMKVLNLKNNDNPWELERYFQALSISTRPNKEILKDLYEQLQNWEINNDNLLDSLVQAVSSITLKYMKFSPNLYEDNLVIKLKDFLLHKLNYCKTINCKTIYIRGLQNFQHPSTIETLIDIALTATESSVSVAAMKALNNFDHTNFDKKNYLSFETIFYQKTKKFDSTARVYALDILLKIRPNKDQLEDLVSFLNSNDKAYEVKTYLIQKLSMLMEKCPKFKQLTKSILKGRPDINNYHVIAQKGLTTALERKLYSFPPAFNESLISVQEITSGVLKQGSVDLNLRSDNDVFSSFKLGLYTSGLASFVAGDSSNSGEEEPTSENEVASAGMEISVQGVQYRPLVFFTGQSELMGHIWSGTGSDPTNAYQATTVQQDHEEYILLQNGASMYVQVLGAKSIDLNGQVELSIWNRNAHTRIEKNSGVNLIGSLKYGTSFLEMMNAFSVQSEPKIEVVADTDFYSDIQLCIQLGKPKMNLRHKIEKKLEIFETNFKQTSSAVFNFTLPGETLALNQKNNQMCNKIAS